jgi:amino acid transporter
MSTSQAVAAAESSGASRRGLRRELHFWEAIALSIGIMAPTAAMALNGVAPASLIGRAVPLVFIFATIGVLFVSFAFIRLSRYFSHAGSVFAFSGITLGPQAGLLRRLGAARHLHRVLLRRGGHVRRGLPERQQRRQVRRLPGWEPISSLTGEHLVAYLSRS